MHSGKIYQIGVDDKPDLSSFDVDESLAPAKYSSRSKRPLNASQNGFTVSGGKSPALASWLSSVLWGSGQIYADHWASGIYFMMTQAVFLSAFILLFIHRIDILAYLKPYHISESVYVLSGIAMSLLLSVTWIGNILHAYRVTRPKHKRPFRGCEGLWPILVGAFWMPGLGQMMNAQTKKGFLFLMSAFAFYFCLFSTLWVSLVWSVLTDPTVILEAEMVLLALSITSCVYIITVAWSYYDAIQINRFPGKRDPWTKRLSLTLNLWRREPFVQIIKTFTLFTLRHVLMIGLLGAAVTAAWYLLPPNFYARQLEDVSKMAEEKGMTMVPELFRNAEKRMISADETNRKVINKTLKR